MVIVIFGFPSTGRDTDFIWGADRLEPDTAQFVQAITKRVAADLGMYFDMEGGSSILHEDVRKNRLCVRAETPHIYTPQTDTDPFPLNGGVVFGWPGSCTQHRVMRKQCVMAAG